MNTYQDLYQQKKTLHDPTKIFTQIQYNILTKTQKQKMNLTENGIFQLKHYVIEAGKQVQKTSRVQADLVQMNQIQRMQATMEIMKNQFKEFKESNSFQQTVKKLIESQNQIINIEVNVQKQELNCFVNQYTEQIQQMHMIIELISTHTLSSRFFRFASKISKILKVQKDCQMLFNFLPKGAKHLQLLFIASQNNFLISRFHDRCDHIPNTLQDTAIRSLSSSI